MPEPMFFSRHPFLLGKGQGVRSSSSSLPRLATRYDVVNGCRMFARVCNDAGTERLPFVLVHGLSMSSRYLVPIARRLARNYRVYAPDLPGYGRSQHPPQTLDIEGLARALKDWMDFMSLGEVYMLGNSLGCQVIVTFVLRYPGQVRKAVLVGPTIDPSAVHLPKLFARAIHNMLFEPLAFYPVLARDYFAAGMRETFQALEYGIRDPIQRKLRQAILPTMVVRGENDQLVTQAWAEKVTRLLPDGRLAVIPGGAHVVNYDAPDRLDEVVEAFL